MSESGKKCFIPVDELLQAEGVTANLQQQIKDADVNEDGLLSIPEVLRVLENEKRATADRKLFRNFLIALIVGVLILIAALCGTVYAIVHLSKEVSVDGGDLVSQSTGQIVSTGSAINVQDTFSLLSMSPQDMSLVETLIFPDATNSTYEIYRVGTISYTPNQKVLVETTTGDLLLGTKNGFVRMDNKTGLYTEEYVDSLVQSMVNGTAKRRLMEVDEEEIIDALVEIKDQLAECDAEYIKKNPIDCRVSLMNKIKAGAAIGSIVPGAGAVLGAAGGALSWLHDEGIKSGVEWLLSKF